MLTTHYPGRSLPVGSCPVAYRLYRMVMMMMMMITHLLNLFIYHTKLV